MSDDLIDQLSRVNGSDADTSRLLGMIMALAGEVFVLKTKLKNLELALESARVISPESLEAAADGEAIAAWMADEEKAFGRAILTPFITPDLAVDATAFMKER